MQATPPVQPTLATPSSASTSGQPSLRPSTLNPASLVFRPSSVAPSQNGDTVTTDSLTSARGGRANRRRGRGGNPASNVSRQDPAASESTAQNEQVGSSRGGHQRRGGPRDAASRGGRVRHDGRQFGGRLTDRDTAGPTAPSNQDDAVSVSNASTSGGRRGGRRPRGAGRPPPAQVNRLRVRRDSSLKSDAPDIATRTHQDISNGLYECPICTSEVWSDSKVWSCTTCWTVFHLSCISKWATNEGSRVTNNRTTEDDEVNGKSWRCPGCNLPKDILPTTYTCWCGKEVEPRHISGLAPHSCGQTCGKPRILPKSCPHPCNLECHAGPCPPCSLMGPAQTCFCGKHTATKKCLETNYDAGWSCGEPCGDLMLCGEHECERPCHEGTCGACDVQIDAQCYCGKSTKSIPCGERGDSIFSESKNKDGETIKWIGLRSCDQICGQTFDCGIHQCEKPCHPLEASVAHCPKSPDVVQTCSCGKTAITEMLPEGRALCTDPIPSCDKQCGKLLDCGHACEQRCHAGPCSFCMRRVEISCNCGRVQTTSICHQGLSNAPQCMRVCRTTLNCGRHECGERCCAGEQRAMQRTARKKKLRPIGSAGPQQPVDEIEAEHICTRQCGRLLKCGTHTCPELCHRGACNTCREAIFEEISCNCGKTVLMPPLPCGTVPPPCRFPCTRSRTCGHAQLPHNCHQDEESCPKCPFLVEKSCLCGKKTLKNQPCFSTEVRCGEVCGKRLKCGSHFCRKACHRPDQCEDVDTPCQQLCGKPKQACGHPDEAVCHAPVACKEEKPCSSKILITCDCQHRKSEVRCLATATSEGNSKKSLDCDDECARLKRNRQLALALNVDPDHETDHVPYSNETLQIYTEFSKVAAEFEKELRLFAADKEQRRLRFKPMQSRHRQFIHSLAEDFGFESESLDPEPHRHVIVLKTPKFVAAPMKTIQDCIRIRRIATVAVPVPAAAPAVQESQAKNNEPFNGFLLTNPRFGLTVDELNAEILSLVNATSIITFDIFFQPSDEIALKARPSNRSTKMTAVAIEYHVKDLKSTISALVSEKGLASKAIMVALDDDLQVLREENDNAGAGWSQIVAKPSRSAVAPSLPTKKGVGSQSSFTVLGTLKAKKAKEVEAKKQVIEEEPVEDWEAEMEKEERNHEIQSSIDKLEDKLAHTGDEHVEETVGLNGESVVLEERA